MRISASDCRKLSTAASRQVGQPLRHASEPTPPNSRCQLQGRGVHVSITLDAAYAARQRYENRMAEQVQFNAPDPAKVPHHVRGIGDRAAGEHFASWIPAYGTLYAVRGNRWLTLAYSVAGESRPSAPRRGGRTSPPRLRAHRPLRPAEPRPSASPARR